MQNTKHILSTRPLSKSIISEAAQHDIIIDELSFIETKPVEDPQAFARIKELSQQKITVAFTSMNAVEAVAEHLNGKVDWSVYCIGNTTKKLVEEKLESVKIAGTAENARALALLMLDHEIKSVVFFCGNIRRDEMPNKLRTEKVAVEEVVVYETIEVPSTISKAYDGILFFSPSAVTSFFKFNKIPRHTLLFAIGKTTKETLRQHTSNKIITAETTGKQELAEQAIAYFSK
jgi:uroporphyrinogen-III synthase